MNAQISPEAVMAYAILAARQGGEQVLIERVSGLFAKLRESKIDEVGSVALRKVPHGLYSEDVEAFFGRLLAGAFAQARSPLDVNERGFELCSDLVDEEYEANPEALKRVAIALGFDLSLIRSRARQQTPA
jgi:hypothetical protein